MVDVSEPWGVTPDCTRCLFRVLALVIKRNHRGFEGANGMPANPAFVNEASSYIILIQCQPSHHSGSEMWWPLGDG